MLYPYHKWLLRVMKQAKNKPEQFHEVIQRLMTQHTIEDVNQFCDQIMRFWQIASKALDWLNHFLHDSELNWMNHDPPIDDL